MPLQSHSCLLLTALCLQIYGAELLNLTRSVAYLSSTEDLQAYGASGAALGESLVYLQLHMLSSDNDSEPVRLRRYPAAAQQLC